MNPETIQLNKKLVEDTLKEVIGKTSVPAEHLLKVVAELHKAHGEYKKTAEEHAALIEHHKGQLEYHNGQIAQYDQALSEHHANHSAQVDAFNAELERSRGIAKGEQGENGLDGLDGITPDVDAIIKEVLTKIPLIPGIQGAAGKDAEFDEEVLLTKFVGLIKKNKLVHIQDIAGANSFVKDGVKYKVEELMHGGGSSTSTTVTTQTGVISNLNTLTASGTLTTIYSLAINGQFQHPVTDYTASGTTITYVTPLDSSFTGKPYTLVFSS